MAPTKRFECLLIGGFVAIWSFGCSKQDPPQEMPAAAAAVDRISLAPRNPPRNFLNKTFQVKSYEKFEFMVPAHTISPRVQGSFQSFVQGSAGNLVSNETADMDLLLLNEEEFSDFAHGKQGTATYRVDPSYSQMVDCALISTLDQPRKYYLVFRNSPGGPKTKFVKADFTASFE